MIESCNISSNPVSRNDELYCRDDESTYANETQLLFLTSGLIGNNFHHHNCTAGVTDSDATMRYVITQSEIASQEHRSENCKHVIVTETEAAVVIQKAYRSFKSRQKGKFVLADWKSKYRKLNCSVDQDDQDSINYIEFWDQSEGQRSPYSLVTNSNSVTDSKGSDYIDIDIENSGIDDSNPISDSNTDSDILQNEHEEEYMNDHIYDSIPFDMSSPTPPGSPLKEEAPRLVRRTHHSECPFSKRKVSEDLTHFLHTEMKNVHRHSEQHSVLVCEEDLINKVNTNLYVVKSHNNQPIVMTINENCPTHRLVHNNLSISPNNNHRTLSSYNKCSMYNDCRVVRTRHEPLIRTTVTQESKILHDQKVIYQKRMYRVGLNLFNRNPVVGINYLIKNQFIKPHPSHIAKFLLTKNGISRNAVGDYIGLLNDPLALQVTKYFLRRINMKNKEVDEALRSFIYYVHLPGESQKISHLMEEFKETYVHQNDRSQFKSLDTIMVLAYAIIMLQTDAHNLSIKKNEKMTLEQFVNNLRGVDENNDIDRNILEPIYIRVTGKELKTMPDHTDQVRRLNDIICGPNKPVDLVNRVRRFMCYCRLSELFQLTMQLDADTEKILTYLVDKQYSPKKVRLKNGRLVVNELSKKFRSSNNLYYSKEKIVDDNKKNKSAAHQREVFLFNDLLMITKLQNKSRKEDQYQCRYALPLVDLQVKQIRMLNYEFGIHLMKRKTNESIIKLNALCQLDQKKFFFDLSDCIFESLEMSKINQSESLSYTHSHPELSSPEISPTNLANQKPIFYQKVTNITPNPPRRQESLVKNERPDVLKPVYQVRSQFYVDNNYYKQILQSGKTHPNNYS